MMGARAARDRQPGCGIVTTERFPVRRIGRDRFNDVQEAFADSAPSTNRFAVVAFFTVMVDRNSNQVADLIIKWIDGRATR